MEDFLSHVSRDHQVHFGEARRRQIPAKNRMRQAKARLKRVRTKVKQAQGWRNAGEKKLSDFKYGVGRTPWLHFLNKRLKPAKLGRTGKTPLTEEPELRKEWQAEWDESPALRAMCEAEVKNAHDQRRRLVQLNRNRRQC